MMSLRARFTRLVLGLLAMSGVVAARALGGPGPDIIVGDLPDTTSYGTDGSGFFAYDIGTESCNVGTTPVNWFASTPQHPVIAQNMFRIRSGRIEQIGLSWVKHGFFATNGNACVLGCSPVDGSHLGVGCSDPYTFGLNGLQTGLGPRSEINAATGVFVYMPSAWPPFSGQIARRIPVDGADIDPGLNAGAVYVAEGIYISPDDAQAGNGWNNASYRFISFGTDAARSATFSGSGSNATRRTKPAIYAWQEVDPAVVVYPIDIPGDGQMYVAARASQNPDLSWRYTYAIQNLNSDRGIQSISIPKSAAGAAITGPQSSLIRYHSGEAYSNVPWTSSTSANGVLFFGETFAQNPNAAVVRWGTLRSVWFDCAQPPARGVIAIDLFKPGAAGSVGRVHATLPTPGGATGSIVPPAADECALAGVLHAGANGFSTAGATGGAPTECTELGNERLSADLWYRYTYPDVCGGVLTFSTCGSDFDTKIAVYGGGPAVPSCPSVIGSAIACNDDAGACAAAGGSSVSVTAAPGSSFLVRIGSRDGQTGQVVLTVTPPNCAPPPGACCHPLGGCQIVGGPTTCANQGSTWLGDNTVCTPNPCPQPPRPPNDLCADAIPIGDVLLGSPHGTALRGNNTNALTDGTVQCEIGLRDVWYRYVPAVSGQVTIDLCDSIAGDISDSTLQVIQTRCNGVVVACAEDGCGSKARATPVLQAGVPYFIRVMGFSGAQGSFTLKVSGGGGSVAGACCAGATCQVLAQSACSGANRRFVGNGGVCNAPGGNTSPCCRADFNQSGLISLQDVFDFLMAFFASDPIADVAGNGSGTPSVQSVFDFLAIWFAGGC